MLELFPQRFAVWKALRVSHQPRPHRAHRLVFVAPFLDRELAMPLNQFPLFRQPGRNEHLARGEIMLYLAEDPAQLGRPRTNSA